MFRSITRFLFAALLPAALLAAEVDLIVPVTGTLAGANGSQWQGELTIHNAATAPAFITLELHGGSGVLGATQVTVAARSTVTYENAITELFGLETGSGAILIDVADELEGRVAFTSRVMNRSASGEFGQDVPALGADETLRNGETGVIAGPARAGLSRFNFGIYAAEATSVTWRLLRATGELAAEIAVDYAAKTQVQYNGGVDALFDRVAQDGDVVHARITSGNALVYGSIVAESTGDPTFVPGFAVRENFAIEFLGIDLDEDGNIDIRDEDRDGVLDGSITLYTSHFPNYFRVYAESGDGHAIEYSVIEAPLDTQMIAPLGTVISYPGVGYKGETRTIVIRASDGFGSADLVIPVNIR